MTPALSPDQWSDLRLDSRYYEQYLYTLQNDETADIRFEVTYNEKSCLHQVILWGTYLPVAVGFYPDAKDAFHVATILTLSLSS